MKVYVVDALNDDRWKRLLESHPRASVFHLPAWVGALKETYGYKPVALTTSPPGEPLANGLVFCDIKSWITGRRLVSLPFSDHCDPLIDSTEDAGKILKLFGDHIGPNLRYAEIRPLSGGESIALDGWRPSETFCFHNLSLDATPDQLFRNLHKNCIQRKVHRAEKECLRYEKGQSESLLQRFYGLMLCTRRRHGLPPQPLKWFHNLIRYFGNDLTIRVASKDDRPIAAILTLSHKNTVVYKYGCSDGAFNQLGATPFLFWKAIQEAKDAGMRAFDLGRSDMDNEGLIAFKNRLGARPSTVTYWHRQSDKPAKFSGLTHMSKLQRYAISLLPDALLVESGKLLYRHMG